MIWAGQIINTFKDAPMVAAGQAWQLLRPSLANISFYAAIYIGLMALAFWLSHSALSRSGLRWNALSWRSPKKLFNRWLCVAICIAFLILSSWIMRQGRELYRARLYQGVYSYIQEKVVH